MGLAREERPAPAHLARGDPLPRRVGDLATRRDVEPVLRRDDARSARACSHPTRRSTCVHQSRSRSRPPARRTRICSSVPRASSVSSMPSRSTFRYGWAPTASAPVLGPAQRSSAARRRRCERPRPQGARASSRRGAPPGDRLGIYHGAFDIDAQRFPGYPCRLAGPNLELRERPRRAAGPKRTGSSAGEPRLSSAAAIAPRASPSPRVRVFSAIAATRAGRAGSDMRSWSSTSSRSGGIGCPGSSSMSVAPAWWQRTRGAERSRGRGRA